MSTDTDNERQWQAKLNETASTLMDRKLILDALDKLLRLKQERQTDLATAVALVGTCPDMCPEQERYFRIETNCVAPFELDDNGTPDQMRMVKEYRRSGADQKEPLPHELRPINVLQRTMNYLCLEIIDKDPLSTGINAGDWFDFIWSRTRSIRKDITQQHLINPESVDLIEKCARFHIYCAYYLCEEGTKNFDPKINEENLHNCLQTLKEFYFELGTRSIYCKNEVEFRTYDVLLNLRNGETLSELKHYRKVIRDSDEIRFSVKIYQAFHSKNHIKFFQMARKANFFMSCILNSFFNQFRIDLLNILRRAYTVPKSGNSVLYPINGILQQFAFDDLEELTNFCDLVDLKYDNDSIYLRRSPSIYTVNIKRRSNRLVQAKLNTSPGRAILSDANQLEILPIHSSFDANNRLIVDRNALSANSTYQQDVVEPAKPAPLVVSWAEPETSEEIVTNDTSINDIITDSGFKLPSLFANSEHVDKPATFPKFNSSFSFASQVEKLSSQKAPSKPDNTTPLINGGFFSLPKPTAEPAIITSSSFTFNLKDKTIKPNENVSIFAPSEPIVETAEPSTTKPFVDVFPISDQVKVSLFDDLLFSLIREECQRTMKQCKERKALAINLSSYYFDELVNCLFREAATEAVQSAKKKKQSIERCSNGILELLLTEMVTSSIKETYVSVVASHRKKQISVLSKELYQSLFDCILTQLATQVLAIATESRNNKITHWRNFSLQRKYWTLWRKFYQSRKKYKFYRDTFPAAPPLANQQKSYAAAVSGGLGLAAPSNRTVIDASFKKAYTGMKRKLVYSKFKSPTEMNLFLKGKLNNRLALQATAINDPRVEKLDSYKQTYYLEKKYFKLWLRKVRSRKRNYIQTQFPAAPKNRLALQWKQSRQVSTRPMTGFTIIDPQIRKATASINRNLLKRLNYDFETTVNMAKRKLEQREQLRNSKRVADTFQSDSVHLEPIRKRFVPISSP